MLGHGDVPYHGVMWKQEGREEVCYCQSKRRERSVYSRSRLLFKEARTHFDRVSHEDAGWRSRAENANLVALRYCLDECVLPFGASQTPC